MPIFLLIVGILLVIVAINNKLPKLGALVKDDFAPSIGGHSFTIWIVAIFVIGAIGYYRPFKPVSNAFLVLVIVAMILANGNPKLAGGGFFNQFNNAIKGIIK